LQSQGTQKEAPGNGNEEAEDVSSEDGEAEEVLGKVCEKFNETMNENRERDINVT
jgi:hypothetical protein